MSTPSGKRRAATAAGKHGGSSPVVRTPQPRPGAEVIMSPQSPVVASHIISSEAAHRREIVGWADKYHALKTVHESTSQKLADTIKQLKRLRKSHEVQSKQLAYYQKTSANARRQRARVEEELESKTRALKKITARVTFGASATVFADKAKELQERIDVLEIERAEAVDALQQRTQEMNGQRKELDTLRTIVQQCANTIDAKNPETITSLLRVQAQLKRSLADHELTVDTLQQDNDSLRKQHQDAQKALEQAHTDQEALEKRCELLQHEVDEIHRMCERLDNEKMALLDYTEEMQANLLEEQRMRRNWEEEEENLRLELTHFRNVTREQADTLQEHTSDHDKLQRALAEAGTEKNSLVDEMKKLSTDNADIKEQLREAQQHVALMSKEHQRLQDELAQQIKARRAAETESEACRAKMQITLQEFQTALHDKAAAVRQLSEVQSRLSALQTAVASKDTQEKLWVMERASLQHQVADLQRDKAMLRTHLTQQVAALKTKVQHMQSSASPSRSSPARIQHTSPLVAAVLTDSVDASDHHHNNNATPSSVSSAARYSQLLGASSGHVPGSAASDWGRRGGGVSARAAHRSPRDTAHGQPADFKGASGRAPHTGSASPTSFREVLAAASPRGHSPNGSRDITAGIVKTPIRRRSGSGAGARTSPGSRADASPSSQRTPIGGSMGGDAPHPRTQAAPSPTPAPTPPLHSL